MPDVPGPGVVVDEGRPGAPPIQGVVTGVAGFVGVTAQGPATPVAVSTWAEFTTTFGGLIDAAPYVTPYWRLPYAVRGFFANGGRTAWIARVLDPMAPAGSGDADAIDAGLAGLSEVPGIELVAAPDDVIAPAFAEAVVRPGEAGRNRLAIVDVPATPDPRVTPPPAGSAFAARYYPQLRVPATHLAAGYAVVPPCGHVMGRLAGATVATGGHPNPRLAPDSLLPDGHPAGVVDVAVSSTDATRLVPAGVNVIRDFRTAGRGVQVWGGRTTSTDPEWKYVNVRRLFLYLERSIDEGTQWVVFEPNGERTWANVRVAIEAFLFTLWRDGALAGITPERAYFVRCDRTTMTQNDLDNGRLIALVGVAPLRPAEFVIFRIGQWTTDRRTP